MGAGSVQGLQPVFRKSALAITHDEGIVVADMSFLPLAMDHGAMAILTDLNRQRGEDGSTAIPRDLVLSLQKRDLRNAGQVRIQVQGQRQAYRCRACFMEPRNRALGGPVLTLHFRRISSAADAIFRTAIMKMVNARLTVLLKLWTAAKSVRAVITASNWSRNVFSSCSRRPASCRRCGS